MIKIITCHHFRHDLAELFYLGVERLQEDYDCQVYAAITKDDKKSIAIAEKNGAKYVLCDNKPLGRKWNKAYELALKDKGQDPLIMILGEDNLVSDEIVKDWYEYFEPQRICVGFNKCGVIDTKTGASKLWEYKDSQRLIGAGRVFEEPKPFTVGKTVRPIRIGDYQLDLKREIPIDNNAMNDNGRNIVKPREIYALWDDNLNSGLDRSSEANLALLGIGYEQIQDDRIHVIDFKTDANIHPFSEFSKLADLKEDWKWFLSVKEKDYIAKKFKL